MPSEIRSYTLIAYFCILSLNVSAQADDISMLELDYFQPTLLDEKPAFKHIITKKVIRKSKYDSINAKMSGIPIINTLNFNNWDTTSVQAYRDNPPKPPFRIDFYEDTFHPPVSGKQVVTSRFGKRRKGPHRGIDIDLNIGDSVRSILAGTVRFVNYSRGHGRTVVVRHDNDLETVYAHLSEYGVKVNQRVGKGEYLGKGGKTGNARGSHLHLEVRYQGLTIHPEYLFDFKDYSINIPSIYVTKKWSNPMYHTSTRKSKITPISTLEPAVVEKKAVQKPITAPNLQKPVAQKINSSNTVHVVVKGDTLYSLARRYKSTVNQLCAINRIPDPTKLKIGQNLKLR